MGRKQTFAQWPEWVESGHSAVYMFPTAATAIAADALGGSILTNRIVIGWLAAIAAAAGPTAPLGAQAAVESRIDSVFKDFDGKKPGCAVGVYRAGDMVFSKGYGLADLDSNLPITPSTVFNVASVSKQFTAFAVALLASEGRLSLDAEVQKYVPELPRFADPITVRHLVHHTSGLRDYGSMLEFSGWRLDRPLSRQQLMALFQRQHGLNFAPGEQHEYSNTNYALLAMIVERVTGRSFRDYAAEKIFRPLGMARTEVRDDPAGPIPKRAVNYTPRADGTYAANRVWDRAYAVGVSNVHTSIEDLAKWDRNFSSPTVGNEALIRTVYSPGRLNSGKSASYAYGLAPGTHRGMPTISHSGIGGGSFFLLRLPEQRLSVATLCNRYGVGPGAPDIWSLSHTVADIFLDDTAKPDPSKTPATLAPEIAVAAAELKKHIGSYWQTDGPTITITMDKGQLIQIYDGKPYPLVPIGPGKFRNPEGTGTYTFGGRDAATVTYHEVPTGFTATGQRRAQWTPTAADLAAAAGQYCTPEVPVCWSLQLVGDEIMLRRPGFSDRSLSPAFADTFSLVDSDEIGTRTMRLVLQRSSDASVSGLSVSRGRVSNLKFHRA